MSLAIACIHQHWQQAKIPGTDCDRGVHFSGSHLDARRDSGRQNAVLQRNVAGDVSEVNGGDAPVTVDQQSIIGKLPGLEARETETTEGFEGQPSRLTAASNVSTVLLRIES